MALLKTHTLGCKVNQYETELVREGLSKIGFEEANQDEVADVCLVNTCTVTSEGDAKSRQVIRRMARKNPGARMIVMGCYATRAKEDVAAIEGVTDVITDKREIPDLLGRFGVLDIPTGLTRFGHRQRAYVKVQDGCLLRCSYCIIPEVRPQMYSRPIDEIVDEIARLVEHGHHEVVLTGIHLGHYGVDFNRLKPKSEWVRLSTLLEQLVHLDGDFRIRLSSIEATEVTRELLDVMSAHPNRICPHLHLCLQSGSDKVLSRMNRRWGARRFVDRCQMFRERFADPAITTDIIVGFPGETDEDFQRSCDVARECEFSKIHIFPFSPRKGTPAASMEDQVAADVKKQRVQALSQLETELRRDYFSRLVGRQLQVLVEESSADGSPTARGTSCRYAPVQLIDSSPRVGSLVEAVVVEQASDGLLASVT